MFRQEALQHRNSVWKAKAILLPGIPLWCIVLSCFVFITFFIVFIISGSYTRRINVSAEVTTWPRPIVMEGANKQVISSQADSLIKISRIWADFFPANNRISLFRLFFPPFLALFPVFTEISPTDVSFGPPETGWPG